jgi:Ferrous iron transport protein B
VRELACSAGDPDSEPAVAIVVLDATTLARSLYLLAQVAQLGVLLLVALTMLDLAAVETDSPTSTRNPTPWRPCSGRVSGPRRADERTQPGRRRSLKPRPCRRRRRCSSLARSPVSPCAPPKQSASVWSQWPAAPTLRDARVDRTDPRPAPVASSPCPNGDSDLTDSAHLTVVCDSWQFTAAPNGVCP